MTVPGFSFRGRVGRAQFALWWFLGSFTALIVALGAVKLDSAAGDVGFGLLGIVLCIPILLFVWSLYVRRLHDFGLSGWWTVLFLIPYLGALFVLPLFVVPGTKGGNRFNEARSSTETSADVRS